MLLRRQVLVIVFTINWIVTAIDGAAFDQKKKNVLREFSNIVVDKTSNGMKIQEYDVKFLDQLNEKPSHDLGSEDNSIMNESGLDFNDEPDGENEDFDEGFSEEKLSNEVRADYSHNTNLKRGKRQAEIVDMVPDPGSDDIQNIWQGMMTAMVDGAKQIVKKVAEGLNAEPPAGYSK